MLADVRDARRRRPPRAHRALRRRRGRRPPRAAGRRRQGASRTIAPDVRAALEVAHANITAYHEAQRHPDAEHRNGRITVRELQRPVDRAACYVPVGAGAARRPRCS